MFWTVSAVHVYIPRGDGSSYSGHWVYTGMGLASFLQGGPPHTWYHNTVN